MSLHCFKFSILGQMAPRAFYFNSALLSKVNTKFLRIRFRQMTPKIFPLCSGKRTRYEVTTVLAPIIRAASVKCTSV